MPLIYQSSEGNIVNCKCPSCGKVFSIDRFSIDIQLTYLSPLNYDIKPPGVKCDCGSYYTSITDGKKISSDKVAITSSSNGCGMFVASIVLFFLIFLMAKGCNVNKSIVPDRYFKSGGGGYDQYQKDVKDGEYIYKLNQELEKQKR